LYIRSHQYWAVAVPAAEATPENDGLSGLAELGHIGGRYGRWAPSLRRPLLPTAAGSQQRRAADGERTAYAQHQESSTTNSI
jgi:hypothetical protein